ncbi:MAG: methyltransferase domain-containing protein [Pseudomonadota bacterium]
MNTTSSAGSHTAFAIKAKIESNDASGARALLKSAFVASPRDPELIALAQRVPNLYAADFYDEQHAGSLASARRILSILRQHCAFARVCDFGAGLGTWLRAAHELGATQLAGFEGPWALDHPERFPEAAYFPVDLNEPIEVTEPFDLAISVEVAEHLLPERSESFVRDLCRASGVVLFGAALPRQPGDGHINCRPHAFWIEQFRRNGYACLDAFRPLVWTDPAVEPWYAQNCFLFVADERRHEFPALREATLFDVYHPLLVNGFVLSDHRAGALDPAPAARTPRATPTSSVSSSRTDVRPETAPRGSAAEAAPMRADAANHWCRIVMNQATQHAIAALPVERLDVLEISGSAWRHHAFRSYTSVGYPDFDICRDVLAQPFDLIIAEQVFEHLRHPARAAANVLRMLRPGGRFLVTTPFLIRFHPEPLDLWRWTADGLRAFLEDCGFVDVETRSWGNRDCVIANLSEWAAYRHGDDLSNDPRFPVVVWGIARRGA